MSIRKSTVALFHEVRLLTRFGLRKMGLPGYQVHQIAARNKPFIYIPIPKNACSTIKHALYEIEYGQTFDYDQAAEWGYRDIHDYYEKRGSAFTGTKALTNSQATIFAIVREPVKRLISCYRNRVIDLKDLEKSKATLTQQDLSLRPDLNTFVLQLEQYRQANKIIEHHSRPQHEFLNSSLAYIDKVFPIAHMDKLKKMLRELKPDLQLRAEKSGGTSFSLADLSETALEKAIRFYRQDYELLSDFYSPDQIRKAHSKTHS